MRFDEKPKRRKFSLKKSRVELPREVGSSHAKKSFAKKEIVRQEPRILSQKASTKKEQSASSPASEQVSSRHQDSFTGEYLSRRHKDSFTPRAKSRLDYGGEDDTPAFREKPEKLPEGYNENETFLESTKAIIANHKLITAVSVVVVVLVVGFTTGIFARLTSQKDTEQTASATDENTFLAKPKTVFTQGKFDLNIENTDAGIETVCETTTDEAGNEKKTCRAKTEEDRKKEQEEKEREEQEKKAKEEREKEEKEDEAAAAAKKAEKAAASKKESSDSSKTEQPIAVIGITGISGCPAEATSGSTIILKSTVLPYNAANQNIIWSSTSAAKVVYEGAGNAATVTIEGEGKAIITAMSVDGGYSEHCIIPIVDHLTE